MKLAASIRYGGQLVNASEVDYNAYRHLGLICPHCSSPVFLAASHERHLTTGLVTKIPAQFRHFKAADPVVVQQCIARVARYDEREIAKRAAVARHQRLKILQRWFWTIFAGRAQALNLYVNDPATKEERAAILQYIVPSVRRLFLGAGAAAVDRAVLFLSEAFEDDDHSITNIQLKRDLTRLTQVDTNLHAAICKEVIKFLQSRTSAYIFEQTIIGSVGLSYYGEASRKALDDGADIAEVAFIKLTGLIVTIPWADEFLVCEDEQKKAKNHATCII